MGFRTNTLAEMIKKVQEKHNKSQCNKVMKTKQGAAEFGSGIIVSIGKQAVW